jgi:hypothetical protein
VGLLSLVSTTEELLGRNSSDSGLERREYGRGDPLRCPRDTHYPQKLALNSHTSGGRSVSMVRSRTQVSEFSLVSVSANVASFPGLMQLIPLRYLRYTDILLRFHRKGLL